MKKILLVLLVSAGLGFGSCSLEEYNPAELNTDVLETFDGIYRMTNQCYSPLYGQIFTATDYLYMSEFGTDIWTTESHKEWAQQITIYKGLTADYNTTNKFMLQAYSAIDKCNTVIALAENVAGGTETTRLQMKGEAEFLRAFYYLMLVEQYGEITLFLDNESEVDLTPGSAQLRPQRNTIEEIYTQIVADLKAALDHLQVAPYNGNYGRATKKSALGMLARTYIQGAGHDLKENGVSYWQRAKEVAEDFIEHMGDYNADLYDQFGDMWLMKNNRAANNKEALFMATAVSPDKTSNGLKAYDMYRNFLWSMGNFTELGFRSNNRFYGRANAYNYVPTRYLLEVFKEGDKRYDLSFISAWGTYTCELAPAWGDDYHPKTPIVIDSALIAKYGIDPKWKNTTLGPYVNLNDEQGNYTDVGLYKYPYEQDDEGNDIYEYENIPAGTGDVNLFTALNPEAKKSGAEADRRIHIYFAREMSDAERAERPYPVLTLDEAYLPDGRHRSKDEVGSTETVNYDYKTQFVPFMCKYMWYDATIRNSYDKANGDLVIQRMAEIYLIAAEANQMLGNTQAAADYINVLHERACDPADFVEGKMKVTAAEIDEDYILDEYARELCGEYQRWYVLKRHHAFEDRLAKYNIPAAENFDPKKHYVRPISQNFLNSIDNAEEYGKNPGY